MSAIRSDLLRVCNDQSVSLDQFKMAFCDRCMQPECTRSRVGDSKFEQRVANWHENLFVNPPRLDRTDPRFDQISGQKFMMIDPGRISEVTTSSWVDPRDLTDANPDTTPRVASVTTSMVVEVVPKVVTNPAQPSEKPTTQQLIQLPTLNTQVQPPRMLGGAPPPPPKADPWAVPEADLTSSTEKIVQPGTKIRLGDGSGV